MRSSSSIQLITKLAAVEAVASEHSEIEPEHVLESLLKFAEAPLDRIAGMVPGEPVAETLSAEVEALRQQLGKHNIESKETRRALRRGLGKGSGRPKGPTVHRSIKTRRLFEQAGHLAHKSGSDTWDGRHLLAAVLASPTPTIRKVLGRRPEMDGTQPALSLLDEWCQDLTRMASEQRLEVSAARQVDAKALLRALTHRRCVLLVCGDEKVSIEVAVAGARILARGQCPPDLQAKRILLLRPDAVCGSAEAANRRTEMFAEAAATENVVLLVPAIEAAGAADIEWKEYLSQATKQGVSFICRVDPDVYDLHVKPDMIWKRAAQVLWLRGESNQGTVPREL